jgi:hypothetical protein
MQQGRNGNMVQGLYRQVVRAPSVEWNPEFREFRIFRNHSGLKSRESETGILNTIRELNSKFLGIVDNSLSR